MDRTPILDLPYIMPSQAQKHVTHNEAIRMLDAVTQISVVNRDQTTAPASPTEGNRHIVASGASGSWVGQDGNIAAWQDGTWEFFSPQIGWIAWIEAEKVLVGWDGVSWMTAGGSVGEFETVGIGGATADSTNRFASNAPATLLNHAGNGHQLKLNKNANADTASILFQTGFSGRAEFGLTGDDDWHAKVSANGSAWNEAIVIDTDNGYVGIGGAPNKPLQLNTGASAATLSLKNNAQEWEITVNQTTGRLTFKNAGGNTPFKFDAGAAENLFRIGVVAPDVVDVGGPFRTKSYSVATLPSASTAGAGAIVYVSDGTGGAVPAFSDGNNWRRSTDRTIVN